MSTQSRGLRRTLQGVVVSDKMEKTVVVAVERVVRHRLYGRVMRRSTKYKAHDAENSCHAGDTVEIVECRPISKQKAWRVSRVVGRAR